jgi:hypothetical protein
LNKTHIYALAAALTVAGLSLFLYKVYVVGFPVSPTSEVRTWNVETRVRFSANNGPVKVSMFLPTGGGRFAIVDEQFVSGGYGFVVSPKEGNRLAKWSIRKAKGKQTLFYQSTVVGVQTAEAPKNQKPPEAAKHGLKGPNEAAAKALVKELKAKSADAPSMTEGLIKKLNSSQLDENTRILLGNNPSFENRIRLAVKVLALVGINARAVHGVPIPKDKRDVTKKMRVITWLEVYHNKQWVSFDPTNGASPIPEHWLRWWTGSEKLLHVEGGERPHVIISVSPKVEEAIAGAVRRGQITTPLMLKFSLLGLPVNTQAVYRIMLLVPIGTLLLVLLRNVVGIKTFGTFMPVLIGLSFRETGLLKGIFLFTLLVALGLAVRFYLERLKLLVVPRLAAVLIVVVIFMALLSILTHRLGGHTGLSVALFPMVILTMIIERMSIVWEERGPAEALSSGLGSIVTATLAFLLMNVELVGYLVFVFPELLLVVLAATILLGRYTGYRLTDLYRFRELVKD